MNSSNVSLAGVKSAGGSSARESETTPRLLIAFELRAYGESIGGVIRALRPDCEVAVIHPSDLDREVWRMDPTLVICNRPNDLFGRRSAWVHFHSAAESEATVRVGRWCLKREDVDLEDLLSFLDWAVSTRRLEATVPA